MHHTLAYSVASESTLNPRAVLGSTLPAPLRHITAANPAPPRFSPAAAKKRTQKIKGMIFSSSPGGHPTPDGSKAPGICPAMIILSRRPGRWLCRLSGRRPLSLSSDPKAVASQAASEVRLARRRKREEEDEICLFNAAFHAINKEEPGSLGSEMGQTQMGRRQVIHAHLTLQVSSAQPRTSKLRSL